MQGKIQEYLPMKQHCKGAIVVYEGDCMETKDKVTKYAGIYNDLAELLGEEAVQIVYPISISNFLPDKIGNE